MQTKHHTKLYQSTFLALSILALTACGGGGGSSNNDASPAAGSNTQNEQPTTPTTPTEQPSTPTDKPTTPPEEPSSKVDALFVPGDTPYYIALGNIGWYDTKSLNATQDADGAFRTIGAYRAEASAKITDLSGNADYAIGSWQGGQVARTFNGETYANSNYYYVVYNRTNQLPQSGSFTCEPHLSSARNGNNSATVNGSATLTVTDSIAHANVSINLQTKDGEQLSIQYDSPLNRPALPNETKKADDSTLDLALGKTSDGGFLIAAAWQVVAGGQYQNLYEGVGVFICH